MNAVLESIRQMILEKQEGNADNLHLRTLKLAQVREDEYFGHVISEDSTAILRDIREAHRTDTTTADAPFAALEAQKQIQAAMNYEGSDNEKRARIFHAQF